MRRTITAILVAAGLVVAFALAAAADRLQLPPSTEALLARDPFPVADPEAVGIDPLALEALSAVAQGYVEANEIVGAELLVIKDRRTVLHCAYGWRDREAESPMTIDTIFNVRSMTKPLTGLAVNLLIEDGALALGDRVAEFIDGFATAASRRITIEQLLTHRSGLPLTILAGTFDFPSLLEMAEETGRRGPEFTPGSRFYYSDAGSDTLGAMIEQVSEQRLDGFVNERLLEPLGMDDSFYYVTASCDDARAGRIASLYFTQGTGWTRMWSPDEPLYPCAWGSQTLYSTPRDYARFLALLLDHGRWRGTRIAASGTIARMLHPVSLMMTLGGGMRFPTGFFELETYYGQMAVLHTHVEDPMHMPVVIGHSGSDGTYAWAWPDHDLMVLFFTQSRGSAIGLSLEAEIDRLLLHPEIDLLNAEAGEAYAAYLGSYVPEDDRQGPPFAEIIIQNGRLAMYIPGEIAYALTPIDASSSSGGPTRWRIDLLRQTELRFSFDATGRTTGFRLVSTGRSDGFVRGTPAAVVPFEQSDVEDLLGRYLHEALGGEIEVILNHGILALIVPDSFMALELRPPNEDGWWVLALNPGIAIRFDRDASGSVVSLTARSSDGETVHPRIAATEDAPDPDE